MTNENGAPSSVGNELSSLSFGEMAALVVFAGPILTSLTLVATGWRRTAVGWALAHQLLVKKPWLIIPGLGGPGLDLYRVLIVAGLSGLGLFLAINAIQKRWAAGQVASSQRRRS